VSISDEDSAAATEAALTKYEHALQITEAQRFGVGAQPIGAPKRVTDGWQKAVAERDFYNSELGREVTDEVIEYDASLPGYKGRRVVCFKRFDTRDGAKPKIPTEPPEGNISESSTTVHMRRGSVGVY